MSERPSPDELAATLKTLRPRAVDLSRDRLMFLAGQAAGAAHSRRWQGGAALMTAASLGLVFVLLARPAPEVRIVHVPAPAVVKPLVPTPPIEEAEPAEPSPREAIPWRLQQALLQIDVGAGSSPSETAEPEEVAAPPPEHHGAFAWEWRKEVLLHPSILEGGQ
jgi:hypothetical protein